MAISIPSHGGAPHVQENSRARGLIRPAPTSLGNRRALAKASDGEVTLLHVIEIIPGLNPEEERDFYQRLEQAALDHLTRLGRNLAEQQVPRREEIVYGNRAHEIVRYAMETGSISSC